jgi:glycosyltransferase involved in cell wall biosynthesis
MKNNKYKVCHLLYEEYPRDPRVRRYVNILNEIGINCIIICSKRKNEKFFENINNNLIYRIPISKKRSSFVLTFIEYSLFTFFSSVLLVYLSIKYKFKIIHIHTLPDFLIFAAVWNKLFGAKLILDLHEIFPELYIARTGTDYNSFKVKLIKLAEKLSVKFADKLITIHDNAKEIFVKRNRLNNEKISVIMNAVDPAEFPNLSNPSDNEFVIIYNGTIVKLLNLTMIADALLILKSQMPVSDFNKIILKIYGDGPALEEILNRFENLGISNKVKYMNYLKPDKMRKEVLKANLLILPPLKNIYSDLFYTIKLIEAVYLKIPVIATRLKTYQRYYSEDALYYFDSGNTEELAERIKEVYYNKELVKKKTAIAKEEYEKVNWNVMKERYINFINSLLNVSK